MEDWYRNTTWNDTIAAEFDGRIRRTRSQKAQYLKIQGITLASSFPQVAVELLERCAEIQDENETAPALASIAGIWLKLGDVDRAIDALNRATAQEEKVPEVGTNAPRDFCFLVAFYERVQLYERAWGILQSLPEVEFGAAGYARNGALAVILAHRGDAAAAGTYAENALRAALDQSISLPGGLKMNPDAVVRQIDNPFTARLIEIHSLSRGLPLAERHSRYSFVLPQ